MASAANRATTLTTLAWGGIEVPVGLYSAHADATKKLADFDTAGPNGGRLFYQEVAAPEPVKDVTIVEEQPHGDPLADAPPPTEAPEREPVTGPGVYRRELVEAGTGEVVEPDQVRRGVRMEDGTFIDCTAQLADIEERTKLDRMEVVGAVAINQVPRARVVKSYYLGAGDERAPYAMRVILEALASEHRGFVVKLTKRSRQTLGFITASRGTLMLYELVWAENFRSPPQSARVIKSVAVAEKAVEQARELVRAYADVPTGALDSLRDDAIALREELHMAAINGEVDEVKLPDPPAPEPDIMAQIEASLAAVGD